MPALIMALLFAVLLASCSGSERSLESEPASTASESSSSTSSPQTSSSQTRDTQGAVLDSPEGVAMITAAQFQHFCLSPSFRSVVGTTHPRPLGLFHRGESWTEELPGCYITVVPDFDEERQQPLNEVNIIVVTMQLATTAAEIEEIRSWRSTFVESGQFEVMEIQDRVDSDDEDLVDAADLTFKDSQQAFSFPADSELFWSFRILKVDDQLLGISSVGRRLIDEAGISATTAILAGQSDSILDEVSQYPDRWPVFDESVFDATPEAWLTELQGGGDTSACATTLIVDGLGADVTVVEGRCADGWAYVTSSELGDSQFIAKFEDGEWRSHTAFPAGGLCRGDLEAEGVPAVVLDPVFWPC